MNIDKVYVEVEVPETYISQLKKNMEVEVFFDSLEGQKFHGTIERLLAKGDPQSRNFIAKAPVQNEDRRIKPGMFARINVAVRSIPQAFNVETQALSRDGEGYSVFKVVGSQVKKVPVSLQLTKGGTATVVSDEIQSGDRIVIEGTQLLQADDRIKIL